MKAEGPDCVIGVRSPLPPKISAPLKTAENHIFHYDTYTIYKALQLYFNRTTQFVRATNIFAINDF